MSVSQDFFCNNFANEKKMSVVLAIPHSESIRIPQKETQTRKRVLSEEAMRAIAIMNKKAVARLPYTLERGRIGVEFQATIDPWNADTNKTVPCPSYDRNDRLVSAASSETKIFELR